MTNNSHFGLFVGGFALVSLVSVYGSEFMPPLLSSAYAGEIAVPGTIEPIAREGAMREGAISFETPRQLTLPPGLPPAIAQATPAGLRPILAKAESAKNPDARAIPVAARTAQTAQATP